MKSVKSKLQEAPRREAFDSVYYKGVDSKAWRYGDNLISEVDVLVYWQLQAQVRSQVDGKLR
jgi:hypothetical protein